MMLPDLYAAQVLIFANYILLVHFVDDSAYHIKTKPSSTVKNFSAL